MATHLLDIGDGQQECARHGCFIRFKPRKNKLYCCPTCRSTAWEMKHAMENLPPTLRRIFARLSTKTKRKVIAGIEASIAEDTVVA